MSEIRRLAAIWAADVVGFSAMIERDEVGTLARLFALRAQVIDPLITRHGGRVFKTTGDGVLAEFASVVDAVQAAIDVQAAIADHPGEGDPLQVRVGVNVGDVVVHDGDLFGDCVNLAARLEGAAEPGGVLISASTREKLPRSLADEFVDAGELSLKNISRSVRGWRWRSGAGPPTSIPRRNGPAVIAVLPFENLSRDPDQDHFADGMVEDLITLLSQFHWFRVVARSSSGIAGREEADGVGSGRRLGAGFVVEGSVRRSGDQVRVTARLVDVAAGHPVWSQRFDRVMDDLFEVQDEIVRSLVSSIVPEYVSAWRGPGPTRPSLSSWELSMRAWSAIYRMDSSASSTQQAHDQFDQALAADPENTLALCGLSFIFANPWYRFGAERDEEQSISAARRATEIDPSNAFAWCLLGFIEAVRSEFASAERHLRRAIALNPSLALATIWLSVVYGFRGDRAGADQWADRAGELSPFDPMLPITDVARALARFSDADYEAAAKYAASSLDGSPQNPPSLRLLAASLELDGDHDGAVGAVAELLDLGPVTIGWLRENLTPFGGPETFGRYLGALARAGIPD